MFPTYDPTNPADTSFASGVNDWLNNLIYGTKSYPTPTIETNYSVPPTPTDLINPSINAGQDVSNQQIQTIQGMNQQFFDNVYSGLEDQGIYNTSSNIWLWLGLGVAGILIVKYVL